MTLFKLGCEVFLGGDILAKVQKVSIGQDGVSYLLTWWDSRQRREEWIFENEIDRTTNSKYEIWNLECTV